MNEAHLRQRIEALGAGPPTADWTNAKGRAVSMRRRRRRLAVQLVALAAVVLVAAPAFAVAVGVIDFSRAERAPLATRLQFDELNTGAPEGMSPGVEGEEARRIIARELSSGTHTLWAAPRKNGGFCFSLEPIGRTCVPGGLQSVAPMVAQASSSSPVVAFGAVGSPTAASVDLVGADGTSTSVALTWVSPPLSAGFFVAELPAQTRIAAFIARDADGVEVSRRTVPARALRRRSP